MCGLGEGGVALTRGAAHPDAVAGLVPAARPEVYSYAAATLDWSDKKGCGSIFCTHYTVSDPFDVRSYLFSFVELLVTPGLQVQCAVSMLSKRIWQGGLAIPRSPRTPRDERKGESHLKQRVVPAVRK